MFVSTDEAITFSPIGRFWSGALLDVAVGRSLMVAVTKAPSQGPGGGVYVSRDGGATWLQSVSPLLAHGGERVFLLGNRVAVSLPGTGLACSADAGRTWTSGC